MVVGSVWVGVGWGKHAAHCVGGHPDRVVEGLCPASGDTPIRNTRQFFNTRHGGQWSCASCHGASASQDGKHASTGKVIRPLAPGFNPERLTDPSKVEKWFKRNCKDVLERECSASEKADVMAWLISVKP